MCRLKLGYPYFPIRRYHSLVKRDIIFFFYLINSLWPSYVLLWHRSESTIAQEIFCCLTSVKALPKLVEVDLSSVKSSDIRLRSILQEILQPPNTKMTSKLTYLHFPETSELRYLSPDHNGNDFATGSQRSILWMMSVYGSWQVMI